MKKIGFVFILFFSIVPAIVMAQSVGINCGVTAFLPIYSSGYLDAHPNHSGNAITPGIRIEGNAMMNEVGFASFGFNLSQPIHDSENVQGWINNGLNYWKGTSVTHYTTILFRFGYAIPQKLSEFLNVHVGFGFGAEIQKTKYNLINYDATVSQINTSIPRMENFNVQTMTLRHIEPAPEVLLNVMYEFEKFYVFAQYNFDFMFNLTANNNFKYVNTIYAGIYYPLKRFDQ